MTKMYYSRADYGDSACRYEFDAINDVDIENVRYLAQEAAQDYHNNRDGWESKWPLEFVLYKTKEGPEFARMFVELEYEPSFYAR